MLRLFVPALAFAIGAVIFVKEYAEKYSEPAPQHVRALASTADPRTCAKGEPVTLYSGSNGHFATSVELEGRHIRMMIDTGASMVALPYEEAERIGLDLAHGRRLQIKTANGVATGVLTTARSLRLGPICLTNIDVAVSAPGALAEGLLGMNVIRQLSRFEMSQTRLVMAQ